MPDAVLVANKNRAKDVKMVVELLKEKGINQAEIFPKDYCPWGWFESLILGDRFQVKRICVKSGAALSLQKVYKHRSEHWIIVEGRAKATIEDRVTFINEGEFIYVCLAPFTGLKNPGKLPMVLIEVQIEVTYEDDIIRYEDAYSRDKILD